jgi:hypothetical protein
MGMTDAAEIALPALDADSLKARFKKRCDETNNVHQNWQIRVHRSLSWMKRAAQFDDERPEAKFLFLWIALNSLYSRWNNEKNAPDYDSAAREDFLAMICGMDLALIAEKLHRHRGLLKKILSNPYLSDVFWRAPEHPKAKGWATADANYIDRHFKDRDYCKVLTQAMQRLFVLRGQIVHGASTGGSRLNRSSLRYCLELLAIFVPLILHIIIDKGCGDDWPDLCYPPQN